MGKRFQESEKAKIRKLIGEGLTYKAVAAIVGRNSSSVRWLCQELGIDYEKRAYTRRKAKRPRLWGIGRFILPQGVYSFRYEACITYGDSEIK